MANHRSEPERFEFSKTRLLNLAPPESKTRRRVVYDSKVPKLAIRITHGGSKTFYVVKRVLRDMEWIKLESFPQMTVKQARDAAELLLGEFAGGANPSEAKRALKAEQSFSDAFDVFLKGKRNLAGRALAETTKRDYADIFRLHLREIHNDKLSEISRERIKSIHRAISKKSPAQADKTLALVGAVFSYAKENDNFAAESPASRIRKNPNVERERFAQPHELPYLFSAIYESNLSDFFLLALLTGARRSNLQSMSWRDVNLKSGEWRIPETKNGSPLTVPLVPEAIEILESRKKIIGRESTFVFPGNGKTKHLVEPKTSWSTLLRRASLAQLTDVLVEEGKITNEEFLESQELLKKSLRRAEEKVHEIARKAKIDPFEYAIRDIRIHDLRRTFGSWQNRTGANLSIIGKSLGHKSLKATQIYTRLDMDPVRASVSSGTSAMLLAAGAKKIAQSAYQDVGSQD